MDHHDGTHLITYLTKHKPILFCDSKAPVGMWDKFIHILMEQLPIMHRLKEDCIYPHYYATQKENRPITSCGTAESLKPDFEKFINDGMKRIDETKLNAERPYIILQTKNKKKGLKCSLTFTRLVGEQQPNLCPIMWALNRRADGFTYIFVKFEEIDITKDDIKMCINMLNGKFKVEKDAEMPDDE